MPIEIKYIDNYSGVILDYSGDVSGAELISVVSEVFDSDNYTALKYWIADRTNCTKYDIGTNHAKILVSLTETYYLFNPEMLLALVAPKDVQYGMSRMYQTLSDKEGFETRVFRSRSDADAWIASELEAR